MTEIKVGMINGRHDLPVEGCILDAVENVLDYDAIANGIEAWIRHNISFKKEVTCLPNQLDYTDIPVWESKERLVVYVTGLTPVTAELIRLCFSMGVHLTLMNYNRDTGEYVPQVIS